METQLRAVYINLCAMRLARPPYYLCLQTECDVYVQTTLAQLPAFGATPSARLHCPFFSPSVYLSLLQLLFLNVSPMQMKTLCIHSMVTMLAYGTGIVYCLLEIKIKNGNSAEAFCSSSFRDEAAVLHYHLIHSRIIAVVIVRTAPWFNLIILSAKIKRKILNFYKRLEDKLGSATFAFRLSASCLFVPGRRSTMSKPL